MFYWIWIANQLTGFSIWLGTLVVIGLRFSCSNTFVYQFQFNQFQPSVVSHVETHVIYNTNQMIGFYMQCDTELKWVKWHMQHIYQIFTFKQQSSVPRWPKTFTMFLFISATNSSQKKHSNVFPTKNREKLIQHQVSGDLHFSVTTKVFTILMRLWTYTNL